MTTREVAEALGLSVKTVRAQLASGHLRSTKRGRDHWVTPAEVERYRRDSLGKPGRRHG